MGGIGGTLAGNGLSMAAMRATLEHVMTPTAFEHMVPLADAWADGVQAGIDAVGAPWHVTRLGARAEYAFADGRRTTARRPTTPTTSSCSSTSTSTPSTAASC